MDDKGSTLIGVFGLPPMAHQVKKQAKYYILIYK